MIVPLGDSKVAAWCTDTFQYIPHHIRNPSMLSAKSPHDHYLPILKRDNSLLTDRGISDEADDILEFDPEVGTCSIKHRISI